MVVWTEDERRNMVSHERVSFFGLCKYVGPCWVHDQSTGSQNIRHGLTKQSAADISARRYPIIGGNTRRAVSASEILQRQSWRSFTSHQGINSASFSSHPSHSVRYYTQYIQRILVSVVQRRLRWCYVSGIYDRESGVRRGYLESSDRYSY